MGFVVVGSDVGRVRVLRIMVRVRVRVTVLRFRVGFRDWVRV